MSVDVYVIYNTKVWNWVKKLSIDLISYCNLCICIELKNDSTKCSTFLYFLIFSVVQSASRSKESCHVLKLVSVQM